MTRAVFLLSKDPVTQHGGDVALFRVAMQLAADAFDVSAICLSPETGSVTADFVPGGASIDRVHKADPDPLRLLAGSLRTRRSLVHTRFDSPALRAAIEARDADVYVAEHSYMAESFLNSRRFGRCRFVVSTHVSEALVWRATRGVLGRLEEPRLLRDELRVARTADAVATYDAAEAQYYRDRGVPGARWLELTLPPVEQSDISATTRRMVFMGARDWPPNQEAFLRALALWPRISAGIPDAELCIVGAPKPGAPQPEYPNGVRDMGFVDDLAGFLSSCRAMIAPVATGGGVRVKLLETARMGMPVVGTSAACGSLADLFGLTPYDDDDAFIAECRRFLLDTDAAVRAGDRLYEANRTHWELRRPHRAVEALLRAEVSAGG